MKVSPLRALTRSFSRFSSNRVQSRNESKPVEGIDTWNRYRKSTLSTSRNESKPVEGIDTSYTFSIILATIICRNESKPVEGIDTLLHTNILT